MTDKGKILARSVLSLVATLAIGGGLTYAAFTSNQVTIANSQIGSGSADLLLCNSNGSTPPGTNTWKPTISPQIDLSGINPGDTNVPVTAPHQMFIGNDSGALATVFNGDPNFAPYCTAYESGVTPGNSTVDMRMVPTLDNIVCPDDPGLADALSLRFGFDDGTNPATFTPYKTLNGWDTNTTRYAPTFTPGQALRVSFEAKLASSYNVQGANCTFDTHFTGEQV